jgi:membrane-associated phospholipid phosphatase
MSYARLDKMTTESPPGHVSASATTTGKHAAFTLCALALLAFLFLAYQVTVGGYLAATVDPTVTHWLAARRSPPATGFLTLVTEIHSTVGIDLMLACSALYLGFGRHSWRDATWLVVAVQSTMVLNFFLKTVFARHRPDVDVPLVHLSTFSFPSGHALASSVLWGCAWALLPPGNVKRFAGFLIVLLVGVVCLSRVYLGAHFLTDVLAGVSEGLFSAAAWSLALPAIRHMRAGRTEVAQ